METDSILAIDLGRYNSVACWYDPCARIATFCTLQSTPEEIRLVLARETVSVVVFEACLQAGWVHDLGEATGATGRHEAKRRVPKDPWSAPAKRIQKYSILLNGTASIPPLQQGRVDDFQRPLAGRRLRQRSLQ